MLEFFEPLHVRGLQPAVLGLPFVLGRRADAVVSSDLIDRPAGVGLFQNRHNLGFSELGLAHGNLLARVAIVPERSPYRPSQFEGSLHLKVYAQLCALQPVGLRT